MKKRGTFLLRYRTPSGSGEYRGFGLRIETGAERQDHHHHHRRYLRHNKPASTRHRYSPESRGKANKWRITRGSKRQARGTGSLADAIHQYYLSGLRHTDAPHNK